MKATPEDRFWRKVRKMDGDGACWVWTASVMGDGYPAFWLERVRGAHVVSFRWYVGEIPEGAEVDHRCRNILCVRPSHLRAVTPGQNQQNRNGATSRSTSGYRGVYWSSQAKKWTAGYRLNRKYHHVGCFASPEDANAAIITARNAAYTHNELDRVVQY